MGSEWWWVLGCAAGALLAVDTAASIAVLLDVRLRIGKNNNPGDPAEVIEDE